jgi:antitoxin component YwqK of YwqJK toxin-antitoxin module
VIQLAALLFLMLTPGLAVTQEMEWYLSDGAAIQYSTIDEGTGLASEWSLSIQKTPGEERIVHYRHGKPVTTWLRSLDAAGFLDREAVEEDGRIVSERLFDKNQLLNLERLFLSDGSVEETRYVRDGNRLVSSTRFKNGNETASSIYLYYPDGRLAGVREQTEGKTWPTGTERPKSGQTVSWTSGSEGLILSIHDNAGRLTGNRTYDGAVLVSLEERIWVDGRLASISTERLAEGTRLILSYDPAGRLASRLEMKDGESIALYEFEYDQEDRLVAERRETDEGLETIDFIYRPDGTLLSETRHLDGLLSLSRTYSQTDVLFEEYYDKGVLFARIHYKDGRKVRETILSGGKVVRERTF